MRILFPALLLLLFLPAVAQPVDSLGYRLQEVEIKPVLPENQLRVLSSETVLDKAALRQQPGYSLLPALNTVPGVRMEERSPGSYRLSIRGSVLRSPFGVRNIKIYLGDLPFTDAGGNTYLNSLDPSGINGIRILKGPEASSYGANTGGVLLIDPVQRTPDTTHVTFGLSGGSYGLFQQQVSIQQRWKKSLLNLSQGYQRSDGYRENSSMQRHFVQAAHSWNYHPKAVLKTLVLFSDLQYRTPGGLTLQQYNEQPAAARPTTATLPGAAAQKAGVHSTTVFGGITHDYGFTRNFRQVTSVFASYTDFRNPFITNYEHRKEQSQGVRTYVEMNKGDARKISIRWNLGAEAQRTLSDVENSGNNGGNKDTLQASDQLQASTAFVFGRVVVDIRQRWQAEASLSYNFFSYRYRNVFPVQQQAYREQSFQPQLMPRLALSYRINTYISWRASAGGGYSPPTIAEVRASDNRINTGLQAEKGYNYETGFRLRDKKDILWMDVTAFWFRLDQAIVRRLNADGTEYFVNAGGTRQPGLEAQFQVHLVKPGKVDVLRSLQLNSSLAVNRFTFRDYSTDAGDYSGNHLTGVPGYTFMQSIGIDFPYRLSLYMQYYYADYVPLNDANTSYGNDYYLVQVKGGWKKRFGKTYLGFFAGIDNLLNEHYSLGNDLNAAGNRYYNAAAPRNFYLGVKGEF